MLVSKSIRVLIVITAFTVLSGAAFSPLRCHAGEAKDKDKEKDKEDDEAQAAKDLADREKKLADEKAKKAAELEAAKAAEAAKKEAEKKARTPEVKPEPVAPVRCVLCQDMKILPNLPYKNYIKFENEPPPNPDYPAPWHICDKCQKGVDVKAAAQEIIDDLKKRQEAARAPHGFYENALAKKFVQFETPYIVVRSMLPSTANHKIADGLEKCANILETNAKSMVLMGTRPDTDEIVMMGDEATYGKFVDVTTKDKKMDPKDIEMKKKTDGYPIQFSPGDRVAEIANGGKPGTRPECFAVFLFAGRLIVRATDGKAKPWLVEGFSSYSENATLGTNLVHRVAYELNPTIKFGKNWNDDMKKLQKDMKVKMWEEIFEIQMEHLKSAEYLHCYSMVSFLIKIDPTRFDKFVLLIKEGMDAGPAIELAYGKKSKDMQIAWRNWIPNQK